MGVVQKTLYVNILKWKYRYIKIEDKVYFQIQTTSMHDSSVYGRGHKRLGVKKFLDEYCNR